MGGLMVMLRVRWNLLVEGVLAVQCIESRVTPVMPRHMSIRGKQWNVRSLHASTDRGFPLTLYRRLQPPVYLAFHFTLYKLRFTPKYILMPNPITTFPPQSTSCLQPP